MLKKYFTFALVVSFSVILVLSGCSSPTATPTPTPEVVAAATPDVKISLNPNITEVTAGQEVIISVEATGVDLNFQWFPGKGKLDNTEGQSVTYTAPEIPGPDKVDLTITGRSETTTRTIAFTVIAEPTDTPTPTPTDTSTPELTDTPIPTDTPSDTDATVALTEPQDDQTVPCENIAKGTYSSEITDPIWPIVYIGNRYYPQDEGGSAPPMVNGSWYGTVRFGDCNSPASVDRGKNFQLIIITANQECNQEIEDYLSTSAAMESWPGMLSLDKECTEHARIVVTRE